MILRLKEFQKLQKSKVYATLLISFLAMLLIPLMLLINDLLQYQKILKDEELRYQRSLLQQVQMSVDERLETVRLIALDIANDTQISNYVDSSDPEGVPLYLQNTQISRLLQDYLEVYNSVNNIQLFTSHYERIITPTTVYSGPLYNYGLMYDHVMAQELVAYFGERDLYCEFIRTNSRYTTAKSLFLLQSIPLWSTGREASGVVAIEVNTTALMRDLDGVDALQQGYVCLVDENGELIAGIGDASLLPWVAQLPDEACSWQKLGQRGRYIVCRIPSRISGWQYVSLQPQGSYVQQIGTVFAKQMTVAVVLGTLGVAAAWLLTRHNYSPLEKVLDRMRHKNMLTAPQSTEKNEYELIEHSFGTLHQDLSALRDILVDEVPRIQENMVYQLLTGTVVDYDSYSSSLHEMGILTPYSHYRVAIIDIADDDGYRVEEQELFRLLLRRQAVQFLPYNIACSAADLQSNRIALLLNGEKESFDEAFEASLHKLLEYARVELQLMLTVCLSTVVDELQKLAREYYDSCRICDRCRALGTTGLVKATDRIGSGRIYICPDDLRNRLKKAIAVGNADEATLCLAEVYRDGIAQSNIDLQHAHGCFVTLIDTMLQSMPLHSERFEAFWSEQNPLGELQNCRSTDEMLQTVQLFAQKACLFMQLSFKSHTDSLCKAVLSYIDHNYTNISLSLSSVADHFHVTPSYISVVLKDNCSETFLNYLTQVRVHHAKQLLKTTNHSIGEIALAVGYANTNSLIRNFRKIEATTPGAFRDTVCRQQ